MFIRCSKLVLFGLWAIIAAATLATPVHAIWNFKSVKAISKSVKTADKVVVADGRSASFLKAAGARRAVALNIKENGQFAVVGIATGTLVSGVAYNNTDDLIKLLASIPDPLLLPTELATSRPDLVTQVLALRKGETELVDELGDTIGVSLAKRAGRDAMVVGMSKNITLSPQAWVQRGLLQQNLMGDLAARMRIVAIVHRTDVVQRRAFAAQYGDKVVFVDSNEALRKALGEAHKRLVTVVGHVEGDSYVLRSAGNKVVVDEPISSVHQQIDEAQSVALALGCNIACVAPATGPTAVIDALAVAQGLKGAAKFKTPLQFLDGLADKIGPMHVETDILGRLRAVSAEHVSVSDGLAHGGGIVIRVLFARSPATPVTVKDIAAGAVAAVLFIPYTMISLAYSCFILGWMCLLLMGMGPRTIWRTTKESYANFTERPAEEIDALLPWERPLLIIFGPIGLLVRKTVSLLLKAINIALALLSIPLIPFFFGPGSRLLLANADSAVGTSWMGEMAGRRVGATAVMLLGALVALLVVLWLIPSLSSGGAATAVVAGLVISWGIIMKLPWLPKLWRLAILLPATSSNLPFVLVHFTSRQLTRFSIRRRVSA